MRSLLLSNLLLFTALFASAQEARSAPQRISLWEGNGPVGGGEFTEGDATITVHRAAQPNGAALVICPGGGYGGLVTGAEGHGIAQWLNGHGITGVVLEYRLPRGRAFVPLLDAQRALRTVRARAAEWEIDPHRIGIIGFSAGGHLASTAGTHFDAGDPQAAEAVDRVSCRPDYMILVYPVISMGEIGHAGSRNNLLGKDPPPELAELFSNEKQVTRETPPAFLAHALDDKVVDPANSRRFYEALRANGVEAQFLELPSGGHGLNGYKGPMWDAWQRDALAWLAAGKFIPALPEGASLRAKDDAAWLASRGELVFQDAFDRKEEGNGMKALGNGWESATADRLPGVQQAALENGVLKLNSATKEAGHAIHVHHEAGFADGGVTLRFRFPGLNKDETLTVGFVDRQLKGVHAGHLAYAKLLPTGITLIDQKTGISDETLRKTREEFLSRKEPLPAELDALLKRKEKTVPWTPDHAWHDLTLVTDGDEMRLSLDGRVVAAHRSEGFAHPTKRWLSFSAQSTVWIADVKIWKVR